MVDVAFWVDDKDFVKVNSDIAVANCIGITITKAAVEWMAIGRE